MFLALLTGLLVASAPAADIELSHSGRLLDATGTPQQGATNFTFRLWTAASGGSAVYTETLGNVPVDGGYYSVQLGAGGGLDDALLSQDLWLGIQIGTEAELAPRSFMAAVPRAASTSRVVDGTVHIGAASDAQCPGDVGTLRWASGTLQACTTSGWVDALNTYGDADAISAVNADDAFIRNTGDTLNGTLTVAGRLRVTHPTSHRTLEPALYEFWRDGSDIHYVGPTGVENTLTIASGSNDYDSTNIRYRANGTGDGLLFFRLDGSPSTACVLLHSEDDRASRSEGLYYATDNGNDVASVWGTGGVHSFELGRSGADGVPISSAAHYEILCL